MQAALETRDQGAFNKIYTVNFKLTYFQEIMILIEKLVLNANCNNYPLHIITDEGWTARPVYVSIVYSVMPVF